MPKKLTGPICTLKHSHYAHCYALTCRCEACMDKRRTKWHNRKYKAQKALVSRA